MKIKFALCAAALSVVTACAQQSRFEWGNYENSLYALYQNPEAASGHEESLRRAIERGEATNRVAPGLNAELGYLLWEQGRQAEAREYFLRERELFPESATFMDRYLDQSTAEQEPAQAGDAALNS
ncbi:MAG: DUF4810 domain-containing protein [Oceanicaulis sp.]